LIKHANQPAVVVVCRVERAGKCPAIVAGH
jgi:hypothetical protein